MKENQIGSLIYDNVVNEIIQFYGSIIVSV